MHTFMSSFYLKNSHTVPGTALQLDSCEIKCSVLDGVPSVPRKVCYVHAQCVYIEKLLLQQSYIHITLNGSLFNVRQYIFYVISYYNNN